MDPLYPLLFSLLKSDNNIVNGTLNNDFTVMHFYNMDWVKQA